MDGTMVHIRDEGWKELKVGCVFDVAQRLHYDEHTQEEIELGSAANNSYVAHLGGGLFGYLYLKSETLRHRILALDFGRIKSWFEPPSKPKKSKDPKSFDQQVDDILDKISKKGMASLTKEEIEILDKRSRS